MRDLRCILIKPRCLRAFIFAALILEAAPLQAQAPDRSPVQWKAQPFDGPVRAGDRLELRIEAAIERNWQDRKSVV